MKILLLEPFYGGAHQKWADQLKEKLSFEVEIWSLPDRFWKWRMHGAAISFAERFLYTKESFDLILASDFLDLAQFKSLTQTRIPTALYFHENQFAYPNKGQASHHDVHYSFLNFSSAINADHIYFNSQYNYDTFFSGVEKMLRAMPDFNQFQHHKTLTQKASILPLGIDFSIFEENKVRDRKSSSPLILWNHRWEHDKNPDEFFSMLIELSEEGFDFQLAVLGERNQKYPPVFDDIKSRLSSHLVHWGHVESYTAYLQWLWKADLCPVTSHQEFFGISVAESIYCECQVFLPNRLSYPDTFAREFNPQVFYDQRDQLKEKIKSFRNYNQDNLKEFIKRYDWENLRSVYEDQFKKLVLTKGNR